MSDAPILAGVNTVADFDSASDFEKKHLPYIECTRDGEKVVVSVTVGHWVAHPNQPDHFIEWIDVYAAGAPVARLTASAVAVDPTLTCVLNVESGTELSAMENCNLHGLWLNTITAP